MDSKGTMKDFEHIKIVNIEHQSFCNKECDWCPNKTFSRNYAKVLSEEVYSSVLSELKENGYSELHPYYTLNQTFPLSVKKGLILAFNGYQEPFCDIDLLKKRLLVAENILSDKIFFSTHTNGDYLTKEALDNLHLSNLEIYDFECKGKEYWENKLKAIDVLPVAYNEDSDLLFCVHRYIESIVVHLNYTKQEWLTSHGGYFQEQDKSVMKKNIIPRQQPTCIFADCSINICYDGSVVPCPFIRPDNPAHQEYVYGNVKQSSLKEIYFSEKAKKFREDIQKGKDNYPTPCRFCQEGGGGFEL